MITDHVSSEHLVQRLARAGRLDLSSGRRHMLPAVIKADGGGYLDWNPVPVVQLRRMVS